MAKFRVRAGVLEYLLLKRERVEAASRAESPNSASMSLLRSARSLLGAGTALEEGAKWPIASLILLREATVAAAFGLVSRSGISVGRRDASTIWLEARELPQVQALLQRVSPLGRERLAGIVCSGVSPEYATWSDDERGHLLESLGRFAQQLVVLLEQDIFTAQRLRAKVLLRLLCAVALIVVPLGTVGYQLSRVGNVNHALHARVTMSSRFLPEVYNPAGLVDGDTTRIGCHTLSEVSPWAVIDLGDEFTVHRVVVSNRLDVPAESAAPLVVELSTDGVEYVEFARKTEGFRTWTAHGNPATARFVRLSIPRASAMHLNEVEVY